MATGITITKPSGNIGEVVAGVAVTGSTTNTFSGAALIPANTITGEATIEIRGRGFKTGVAGNCTMRMYFNSTPDLAGTPVLLATHTASAANTHAQFVRQVYIDKTYTTVFNSVQNANTDDTENAAGRTVITTAGNIRYDLALYLVLAIQNGNAADSTITVVWYSRTHGY